MAAVIDFNPIGWLIYLAVLAFIGLCLKLGARLVGVRIGLARAMAAVFVSGAVGVAATLFGAILSSPPVGGLIGLAAVLAVLKAFLKTTWPRTLLVWFLFVVVQALLAALAAALTGLGLWQLFQHLQPLHRGPGLQALLYFFPLA